jgi:hypothetical protein
MFSSININKLCRGLTQYDLIDSMSKTNLNDQKKLKIIDVHKIKHQQNDRMFIWDRDEPIQSK